MTEQELCEKARDLYIQYVSMEGCEESELNSIYGELNKSKRTEETLEAVQKLLYIKLHKIGGVMKQDGKKVRYLVHGSVVSVEVIK